MKIIISSAKTLNENAVAGTSVPIFENEMYTLVENGFDKYIKDYDKKRAIDLYNGLVFKYMQKEKWHHKDYEFANEHLRILSAMYGILRPDDSIYGYRLDFNIAGKQHYNYWKEKVNQTLSDEIIINLASKEFSDLITVNMINIKFINSQLKSYSTMSKMARGRMINFIIQNKITTIDEIKKFHDGFHYEPASSNKKNLVFIQN